MKKFLMIFAIFGFCVGIIGCEPKNQECPDGVCQPD